MTLPISSGNVSFVKRFDNAGIAVRDLEIMQAFYRDVLGAQILPLEGGMPSFGMFLGGVAFFVFQTTNSTLHSRTLENFLANPPGYDHLVFEVDDIVAVQAWLEAQGVTAGSLEDVSIPGIGDFKYLRFTDPEGNLLGLRQPVKKPGD